MANNYSSIDIKVFPTTYRTDYVQGKFTSEKNFVNILNSLTDNIGDNDHSFIVEYESGKLKVIIHGYYFEISISSLPNNLWLGISVEKSEGYEALVAYGTGSTVLDENNMFLGLVYEISSSKPNTPSSDNYDYYWLRVTDENGLYTKSKAKFNSDSVYYSTTEGNVTDALNGKQDNLTPTNGISIGEDNSIKIDDTNYSKLTSLNNKGSRDQFVYFDSNGQALATDKTVGHRYKQESSYSSSQNVYMLNGKITEGVQIFASINNPTGGQDGDIWIKYV